MRIYINMPFNIDESNINLCHINKYLSEIKSEIKSDIKSESYKNKDKITEYLKKIKPYKKSDINLEPYDLDVSKVLLFYLISNAYLKPDNTKIWIITSIDNDNIKLKGYLNDYSFKRERNSKEKLIEYGINDENIDTIINKFGNIIIDSETVVDNTVLKKKLLKFNTATYINDDGLEVYDKLVDNNDDNNDYIYYYTTNYNILGNDYILNEGTDYALFKCTFRCIKINVTKTDNAIKFKYDILFKYINKKNTLNYINKYINNHYSTSLNYFFSTKGKLLEYNIYVNADGRRIYDFLQKMQGYYIYIVIVLPNKKINDEDIKEGSVCKMHKTKFIYDKIIDDLNGKRAVILKYIGDFTTKEDIIKYGILYKNAEILPKNALLYYIYVNEIVKKIYDELLKEDYYIYYSIIYYNYDQPKIKGAVYEIFNTLFICDIIIPGYPSSNRTTIIYKYIESSNKQIARVEGEKI